MTIDHKAEAERLAGMAGDTYGMIELRNEGMSVSMMIEAQTLAVSAQVHATLYLAEQQRIANLLAIALGQHADTGMSRVASDMAYISLVENGEDGNLRPDIARALGLDKEDAS